LSRYRIYIRISFHPHTPLFPLSTSLLILRVFFCSYLSFWFVFVRVIFLYFRHYFFPKFSVILYLNRHHRHPVSRNSGASKVLMTPPHPLPLTFLHSISFVSSSLFLPPNFLSLYMIIFFRDFVSTFLFLFIAPYYIIPPMPVFYSSQSPVPRCPEATGAPRTAYPPTLRQGRTSRSSAGGPTAKPPGDAHTPSISFP